MSTNTDALSKDTKEYRRRKPQNSPYYKCIEDYCEEFKRSYDRKFSQMLDFAGIGREQLPELIERGKKIGPLNMPVIKEFGFSDDISLNAGALNQMAGMIGVGNVRGW